MDLIDKLCSSKTFSSPIAVSIIITLVLLFIFILSNHSKFSLKKDYKDILKMIIYGTLSSMVILLIHTQCYKSKIKNVTDNKVYNDIISTISKPDEQ
jgi:hypothetical protein